MGWIGKGGSIVFLTKEIEESGVKVLEFIKDVLIVLARILTILPLLLFITLYMGKRAIGEIPVFDFLVVIILVQLLALISLTRILNISRLLSLSFSLAFFKGLLQIEK